MSAVSWLRARASAFLGGAEVVASPEALAVLASIPTAAVALLSLAGVLIDAPSHRAPVAAIGGVAALLAVGALVAGRRVTWPMRAALEVFATLALLGEALLSPSADWASAILGANAVVAVVGFATVPALATVGIGALGVASFVTDGIADPRAHLGPLVAEAVAIFTVGSIAGWLARLAASGHIDPLTQVANRRGFAVRIEPLVAEADREGRPVGVIMLDLDHFKRTNDSLGHPAADELLVRLSRCLRSLVRPADLVVRWGGDEFLVVVPVDREADVERVALRLGAHCSSAARFTMGWAVRRPGSPIDHAIVEADAALLAAKRARATDADA